VLIEVIPELKPLLGPDFMVEPLARLGPVERESWFRDAFGRLLAICKLGIPVHPMLVLGHTNSLGGVCVCYSWSQGRSGRFAVVFAQRIHADANIAEEANRKMREWGMSSVDTPTGDSSATEGPPRNGMRQSNGPWDRGWKAVPLVHLYSYLPLSAWQVYAITLTVVGVFIF
jgi:hypothetical protein